MAGLLCASSVDRWCAALVAKRGVIHLISPDIRALPMLRRADVRL